MVVPPRLEYTCAVEVGSTDYNNSIKLYNITIIVHQHVYKVSIRPEGLAY